MFLTTGDLARAMKGFYPVNHYEVAGWCEAGILPARQNPNPKLTQPHWRILPASITPFLKQHLNFSDQEAREVEKRLGINFNQLRLVA